MHRPKIIVIAGPTASGKSELALSLARKQKQNLKKQHIICGDVLQLYERLPLLTAQPSLKDKEEVSHEMYGMLKQDTQVSLAWWFDTVSDYIHQHPQDYIIIVGGTGMYLKSLVCGVSNIPYIPLKHRQEIEDQIKNKGLEWLFQELCQKDPAISTRLSPRDKQRLSRAYEVITYTGKSLAHYWAEGNSSALFDIYWINILPSPAQLKECITIRFNKALDAGLLEEVAQLKGPLCQTLSQAIGLKELQAHLAQDITLQEAATHIIRKTCQYAKRQRTWFRHQSPQPCEIIQTKVNDENIEMIIENLETSKNP